MTDPDLAQLRDLATVLIEWSGAYPGSTHYEKCWRYHHGCADLRASDALIELADEVERLRAIEVERDAMRDVLAQMAAVDVQGVCCCDDMSATARSYFAPTEDEGSVAT